jgi:uncharacterized protein (DUF849 family)
MMDPLIITVAPNGARRGKADGVVTLTEIGRSEANAVT